MLNDLQASWIDVAKSIGCITPGVHITSMTIVIVKLVILYQVVIQNSTIVYQTTTYGAIIALTSGDLVSLAALSQLSSSSSSFLPDLYT